MAAPINRTQPALNIQNDIDFYLCVIGNDNGTTASGDYYDFDTDQYQNIPAYDALYWIQLKVDKLTVKKTRTLVDHSTAQQNTEKSRIVKSSFTIQVDTKCSLDGYEIGAIAKSVNNQVVYIVGLGHNNSFNAMCIVESVDVNYDNPVSFSMTARSYGFPLVWNSSDDYSSSNGSRPTPNTPL